jgi:hypothetical protein
VLIRYGHISQTLMCHMIWYRNEHPDLRAGNIHELRSHALSRYQHSRRHTYTYTKTQIYHLFHTSLHSTSLTTYMYATTQTTTYCARPSVCSRLITANMVFSEGDFYFHVAVTERSQLFKTFGLVFLGFLGWHPLAGLVLWVALDLERLLGKRNSVKGCWRK